MSERISRTAENLPRHELIGLTVTANQDTDTHTVSGTVTDETRNTLHITTDTETVTVPKDTYTFTFTLPNTGEDVTVTGTLLQGRPAERLKQSLPTTWRNPQ